MAYTPKPNTGSLFKNQKKADNHPDYKGNVLCKCEKCGAEVETDIAGWNRTSAKGINYISVKLSKPFKKEQSQSGQEEDWL